MTTKTDVMLERLDSILEQLEALGISPRSPVAPEARLDASGNPSLVAPAELIESAWGNAVVGRIVPRYPDQATLAAASGAQGALAVTTDHNVVWIREGGAWRPTAIGNRISFRGVGSAAGQSIGPGVLSIAGWNFPSEPWGVISSGSTFTVPAGWGGRWQFEWSVEFPDGGQNGFRYAFAAVAGNRLGQLSIPALEGGTPISGSGSLVMTAGQTAYIYMYHTDNSGALTCNTVPTEQYFQGAYAGPY